MSKRPPLTRRKFLKDSAAATGALLFSKLFQPSLLMAQSIGSSEGKNLILINLAGGCDGLTMFPYYSGEAATALAQIRPTIKILPQNILNVHPQNGLPSKLGLHPALAKLAPVVSQNGRIIQRYGIIHDPGRSHDLCQQLMDLGVSAPSPSNKGFMAKFADHQNFQMYQYWGFSESSGYFAFNTEKAVPIVVDSLENFAYQRLWSAWGDYDQEFIEKTRHTLVEISVAKNAAEEKYRRSLSTTEQAVTTIRNDIASQTVGANSQGNYSDDPLGRGLRDSAKVIRAKNTRPNLGISDKTTAIYLTQNGYDHHSNIANPNDESNFSSLATSLGNNLAVFIEDLKLTGVWQKSVIVLFSEFGRTSYENGTPYGTNVGTDHGWGSTTLVLGGAVNSGVIGEPPTAIELKDTEMNAIIPTIDYRDIFSDIFVWLGVDPYGVFDEAGYQRTPLGIL